MRLEQATQQMQLRKVPKNDCGCGDIRVAKDVARRVFELSAAFGEPYKGRPDDWAKEWLASKRFTLVAVAPYQVAIPYANRIDRNKVLRTINASTDGTMEPIVVDVNKKSIGKTQSGYVPNVIVVDGKHRHKAQTAMGKDRILAWVGELALQELQERAKSGKKFVIEASTVEFYEPRLRSTLESTALMHFAVATPTIRQDSGDGGSRPTGGTQVRANKHKTGCNCAACKGKMEGMGGPAGSASLGSGSGPVSKISSQGARSSGSLSEEDPSDKGVPPDPSDTEQSVNPSDRLTWDGKKPQAFAPGGETAVGYKNPVAASPGSGVGPGVTKNYGAKRSELNRGPNKVNAKAVKVGKLWTKDKKGAS